MKIENFITKNCQRIKSKVLPQKLDDVKNLIPDNTKSAKIYTVDYNTNEIYLNPFKKVHLSDNHKRDIKAFLDGEQAYFLPISNTKKLIKKNCDSSAFWSGYKYAFKNHKKH